MNLLKTAKMKIFLLRGLVAFILLISPLLASAGFSTLLWQNSYNGYAYDWLLDGNLTPKNSGYLGVSAGLTAWQLIGSADLDGKGDLDLIWQNKTDGSIVYWLMQNGASSTQAYFPNSSAGLAPWRLVGTVDLNGDGQPDLIWQNKNDGSIVYWLMNGVNLLPSWDSSIPVQGYFSGAGPTAGLSGWTLVGMADLNGDGKPDFVWQNKTDGSIYYWLMNGINLLAASASTIPVQAYFPSGDPKVVRLSGWTLVGMADLNGDGKPDLVWQNQYNSSIYYWLMNGINLLAASASTIPVQAYFPSGDPTIGLTGWRLVAAVPVPPLSASILGDYRYSNITVKAGLPIPIYWNSSGAQTGSVTFKVDKNACGYTAGVVYPTTMSGQTGFINLPTTACQADTTLTFTYQVVGYNGQSAQSVLVVNIIKPSPPSLSISSSVFVVGNLVSINVTDDFATATDWVGMITAGSTPANGRVDWRYLNDLQTAPTAPVTFFPYVSFNLPAVAGQYYFVLVSGTTGAVLAQTPVISSIPLVETLIGTMICDSTKCFTGAANNFTNTSGFGGIKFKARGGNIIGLNSGTFVQLKAANGTTSTSRQLPFIPSLLSNGQSYRVQLSSGTQIQSVTTYGGHSSTLAGVYLDIYGTN